jgi:hypothetical protein
MDFTDAYAEAVTVAEDSVTHYDCLTFASSLDVGTVMVVHSNENLETPQGTYMACPFEFQPPETEGEIVGQMKITVNFLPKAARIWLMQQSRAGAQLSVTWRQYLEAGIDPDFECRVPFYITKVERNPGGVVVTATLPDLVNTPFCRRLMLSTELPGMVL